MFNNDTDGDIRLGGGALGRGSICTYNGVEYLEVSRFGSSGGALKPHNICYQKLKYTRNETHKIILKLVFRARRCLPRGGAVSASAGTGRSGARRRRAAARPARPGARAPSISAARVSHRESLRSGQFSEMENFPCLSFSFSIPMQWRVWVRCLGQYLALAPSRVRNKCWKVHGAS